MVDLNVLKIAGAFVAGLAGIIGILGQTRTQENKLTRSGKCLFGMAIVGVALAVSTQIWEWRKSIEDDRTAQRKNQELLLKLDKEAQLAATSLHEVRRAVTRFQTISFDWYCRFNITDKLFGPYISDLAKRTEDMIKKPPFKEGDQGLHLQVGTPASVAALIFDADSAAMPDEGKYALLRHYILEAVPEIRVFKTPISPESFLEIVPDHFNPKRSSLEPDLILKLNPGKLDITFPIHKTEPKVSTITVGRSGMDASISYVSDNIVSLEDLGGCQAIIYLPRVRMDFLEPWRTASGHLLRCRVNGQIIAVSSDFPVPTSRIYSPLLATQTRGPPSQPTHGPPLSQPIYSFTFPTPTPAKVNH